MSVRTYIVESLLPGGSTLGGGTAAGGDVLLDAPAHAHDGPSHTGLLPLEAISTTETDTTLVARPDGAGGVAFGAGTVEDATVPTYTVTDFVIADNRQALFSIPIVLDVGAGIIVGSNSALVEVH